MLFKVKIKETRTMTAYVDVDYDFEACKVAKQRYDSGIICTDVEDVTDVTFELEENNNEEIE